MEKETIQNFIKLAHEDIGVLCVKWVNEKDENRKAGIFKILETMSKDLTNLIESIESKYKVD